MFKNVALILLSFVVPINLRSQSTGLLVSDEQYKKIPLLPTYSGVKYTEVPVKVSLKKYCPVPGDQGNTGACVGWAVGYGALTIQRAILSQTTDQAIITQQANSAAFIYNQVRRNKTDCNEGAYLEDALFLLKNMGDCLENSFNYEQQDCQAQPGDLHFAEARRYKAQDFAAVFALDEDPKSKIGKACKILATNTPLVVGMGVTKSFFEILPGANTWNPVETEAVTGYHAMVLTGYNSVEKYFELLNSFGPSWGQNGFIRLPFDDFERLCRYAYVIVPETTLNTVFAKHTLPISDKSTASPIPDEQHFLSGEFVFRQPAGFVTNEAGDELIYFEEIKTRHDEALPGFYTTEKTTFKVGDVFQLVAREIPRGRYVYVFSQSADGTLNQHFPRKKDAVATASFVLEKTVEIVIPSEESLLQLPLPGEDYLCILYSYSPILNFEYRLRQIGTGVSDFPQKVRNAFADLYVAAPNVQYSPDRMSFTAIADPANGRVAVAMILRVKAE
ncbi:MAG: hypothetical protein OHK0019_31920 [Saprospiraceae bacterium]